MTSADATRQPAASWETLIDPDHGARNICRDTRHAHAGPVGDCLACGKPVRWDAEHYDLARWVHVANADVMACPQYADQP